MKLKLLILSVCAVAVLAVVWCLLSKGERPVEPVSETVVQSRHGLIKSERPQKGFSKDRSKRKVRPAAKKVRKAVDFDEFADCPPEEQQLAKRIGEALDADDFNRVAECVGEAAACKNPDIRTAMVDALQWFGRKAMPELTSFMADSDDDVRQGALDAWLDAVQEVESPTEKFTLLAASIKAMNDSDAIDSMLSEAGDLPNSYQIALLSDLIQNGNAVVREVAGEHYEFLTDEEYTTQAAAESWLKENPDDEIEVEEVIEKDKAEGVETPLAQ